MPTKSSVTKSVTLRSANEVIKNRVALLAAKASSSEDLIRERACAKAPRRLPSHSRRLAQKGTSSLPAHHLAIYQVPISRRSPGIAR